MRDTFFFSKHTLPLVHFIKPWSDLCFWWICTIILKWWYFYCVQDLWSGKQLCYFVCRSVRVALILFKKKSLKSVAHCKRSKNKTIYSKSSVLLTTPWRTFLRTRFVLEILHNTKHKIHFPSYKWETFYTTFQMVGLINEFIKEVCYFNVHFDDYIANEYRLWLLKSSLHFEKLIQVWRLKRE